MKLRYDSNLGGLYMLNHGNRGMSDVADEAGRGTVSATRSATLFVLQPEQKWEVPRLSNVYWALFS